MGEQWFCARTQFAKERVALANLENQDFRTYLPLYVPLWGPSPKVKIFLPGYIFVRCDLEDQGRRWRAIMSTIGISTLLFSAGMRPEAVPDWVIDDMMAREKDGIIQLPPRTMTAKQWRNLNARFQNGDLVHMNGAGMEVVFAEMEDKTRARVFFELLGKVHWKVVPLAKLHVGRARGS